MHHCPMASSHPPIKIHLKLRQFDEQNYIHTYTLWGFFHVFFILRKWYRNNQSVYECVFACVCVCWCVCVCVYGVNWISYHSFSNVELVAAYFRDEASIDVVATRVYYIVYSMVLYRYYLNFYYGTNNWKIASSHTQKYETIIKTVFSPFYLLIVWQFVE